MVRAVLKKGKIQPLDDLPESWPDGRELIIEEAEQPDDDDPQVIAAVFRELDEAVARIPEEEHERFLSAIEEHRKESKEQAKRDMGLP
jgi:hypothetical protein